MNQETALERVRQILDGIDVTMSDDGQSGERGWWECGPGDEFGARKLSEIEALIREAIPE